MKTTTRRPISLTDARSGKRLRISWLKAGAMLCLPILGYWHRESGFTVYVAGTMAASLRTAAEEGRENEEVLLRPLRGGIQEIQLEDCRQQFQLLPTADARVIPMVIGAPAHSQAA